MIDVLIVLLIFLMLTTSFRRETNLQIRLPRTATSHAAASEPAGVEVTVSADGEIAVNQAVVADGALDSLKEKLAAAGSASDGNVLIRADRATPHEAVMRVLDAASQLGMARIRFAMETSTRGAVTPPERPARTQP